MIFYLAHRERIDEDGMQWWYLYEFTASNRDDVHTMAKMYEPWFLKQLGILNFVKRYSSREELEIDVNLRHGNDFELLTSLRLASDC